MSRDSFLLLCVLVGLTCLTLTVQNPRENQLQQQTSTVRLTTSQTSTTSSFRTSSSHMKIETPDIPDNLLKTSSTTSVVWSWTTDWYGRYTPNYPSLPPSSPPPTFGPAIASVLALLGGLSAAAHALDKRHTAELDRKRVELLPNRTIVPVNKHVIYLPPRGNDQLIRKDH